MSTASRDIQILFQEGAIRDPSDGALLERFLSDHSETAFALLLERHGPMVWGICRRVVGDHHDAEDAFQAAFLVLARKAASVSPRDSVGNWLYGVANRTALKVRALSARQRARVKPLHDAFSVGSLPSDPYPELPALLDEELVRLPERYRVAIVLCDLEGRTRTEAARELGLPEGTVASRLSRGRSILANRLSRRGVSLPTGALALWFANDAAARVPAGLSGFTAKAARLFALGQSSTGLISSRVSSLANWGATIMGLKQTFALVTMLAIGLGGGSLSYLGVASEPPKAQKEGPAGSGNHPDVADVRQLQAKTQSALDDVLKDIPAVEDDDQKVWLLCETARVQARAGLDEPLRETLKRAVQAAEESESDHRRRDVAAELALSGRVREALELSRGIRGEFNRQLALASVAAGQAKIGDLAGALRTAKSLTDQVARGEALRSIADAQVERGDFRGALETAKKITRNDDLASCLATIALHQIQVKDPGGAQTLAQARETAERTPNNGAPTLSAIVEALAASGSIAEARKVVSSIPDTNWLDIARKHLVAALAKRGEIDAALDTVNRIRSNYEQDNALKEVVAALTHVGDLARAQRVADKMAPGFGRSGALLEIAKGHSRAGHPQNAAKIFATVRQESEQVKDQPGFGNLKPASLGRLAKMQAEVGDERSALAWIETHPPLTKAWALLGLAEGFAERLPVRPVPPPPLNDSRPDEDALRAAALAGVPPVAAPALRKPSRSFKGKVVLFGAQRDARPDTAGIEAIEPDGTGLEALLTADKNEWVEDGRESRDGSRLAFSLRRRPDVNAPKEIWVFTADGMRRKLAAEGTVVAWSPDASQLIALQPKGREFTNLIVDVNTGQTRLLPLPKTDVVWDWSPVGESLAAMGANTGKVFQHPTKGTYPLRQVFLIKPDGSDRKLVPTGPMLDSITARFSPDGTQLVYQERRHKEGRVFHFVVVQSLGRGAPRDLVEFNEVYKGNKEFRPHGSPCWSPDGKSVVWLVPRQKSTYADQRFELLIVSVSSGKVTRIDLSERGLRWVQAIDWQ